jgi:molecular chaperone DnaK
MLEKCTKRHLDRSLSPDTAIAMGAALFAAHGAGAEKLPLTGVITVNSHPLGLMVRSRQTKKVFNDVLLAAGKPTGEAVLRTYGIQPGMKSLTLAILLGDSRDLQACTHLGRGTIPNLPPDLTPDDRIDVKFCFLKNGLLHIEGQVRRKVGPPLKVKFEIQVEGKMSETEVDAARMTLGGLAIEGLVPEERR